MTTDVALYRKYRPHAFADMRGQEHIVSVLEAAAKNEKVTHAYLFSGSRGTGKTSLARIFAAALDVSEKDIYEIDAASHTGVDNIRELREAVGVLPFESPYKVYIVDEVHMLSKAAFNALLKTLEEPPRHVIFILATTELEKVPDTVISRCQTFTFKKPPQTILREAVQDVAKKEKYTLEPEAADLVALLADGSFRDALGILQKVLTAASGKKVSAEDVAAATGAPPLALIRDAIEGLEAGDSAQALAPVRDAAGRGIDAEHFLKMLLHVLRSALLLRYAPDMKGEIQEQFGEDMFGFLDELAKKRPAETKVNSTTLRILLEAALSIKRAAVSYLPIELAVIDITADSASRERVDK